MKDELTSKMHSEFTVDSETDVSIFNNHLGFIFIKKITINERNMNLAQSQKLCVN